MVLEAPVLILSLHTCTTAHLRNCTPAHNCTHLHLNLHLRCQENHLRPQEFDRPGIFCKKEPESAASTSRSFKTESKYQSRISDRGEDQEYVEDQKDSKT